MAKRAQDAARPGSPASAQQPPILPRLGFAAASVVAALLAVVLIGGVQGPQKAEFPLQVDPAELDLGNVWASDAVPWTLRIANVGAARVTVDRFESSCPCATMDQASLCVEPGASARLRGTLRLTTRNQALASMASRPFSVVIRPVLADAERSDVSWSLHGVARAAFVASPFSLNFGGTLFRGDEFTPQAIHVAGEGCL